MTSEDMGYNPFYYVQRQLGFAAAGVALAFIVSRIDYRAVVRNFQAPIWIVTIGMLAIILLLLLALMHVVQPVGFQLDRFLSSRLSLQRLPS